ncbi:DUF924 domain-containing protein [Sinirhodobacter sp. WL0062]|uniref:DUF924 domain-containing protein n=1 Tax=Rhodobacter flavimaris TaxID=2907145 RepID=A0ABS8Z152_9RHOB|nr:DUF924 family protein [Sinirhodobacter sp. WL0062]MCE5974781.1 DUF924 domain-containing protein [Sinirhodobacter sp. WL0062]
MVLEKPEGVLEFWFAEEVRRKWYAKDESFDQSIVARFSATYEAAHRGELDGWIEEERSALALMIVLDQFPRNMFRGSPRSFESNEIALAHARTALARGYGRALDPAERQFFYLPFMHSEALADQELSVALYRAMGEPESLKFAILHRDIVARFGRFPHRNAVLGRASTEEETEFLKTHPGF